MAKGGQGPEGLTGSSANCRTQRKLCVCLSWDSTETQELGLVPGTPNAMF